MTGLSPGQTLLAQQPATSAPTIARATNAAPAGTSAPASGSPIAVTSAPTDTLTPGITATPSLTPSPTLTLTASITATPSQTPIAHTAAAGADTTGACQWSRPTSQPVLHCRTARRWCRSV